MTFITTQPLPTVQRFRERVRARAGTAELLAFRVGGECWAVELKAVEQVVDAGVVRPVPGAAPGHLGVFAHEGLLLPLYDAALPLGVPATGRSTVLLMRAGACQVGLAVNDVLDVMPCDLAELLPPPDIMGDDMLVGVQLTEDMLIGVLDARALISACLAGPSPVDL